MKTLWCWKNDSYQRLYRRGFIPVSLWGLLVNFGRNHRGHFAVWRTFCFSLTSSRREQKGFSFRLKVSWLPRRRVASGQLKDEYWSISTRKKKVMIKKKYNKAWIKSEAVNLKWRHQSLGSCEGAALRLTPSVQREPGMFRSGGGGGSENHSEYIGQSPPPLSSALSVCLLVHCPPRDHSYFI